MAEEKDFNDALDEIFLSEDTSYQKSYDEGFKDGSEAGNSEGYHLGYHRGAELGRELGYYLGIVSYHIELNDKSETKYSEKIASQLLKVKKLIDEFPRTNSEDHDILGLAETIRAQYKKVYSSKMMMMLKIRHHLDSMVRFLNPLLPLANCHMVEFFTQNHWEKLVPTSLKDALEGLELNEAVDQFWRLAEKDDFNDNTELDKWITAAKSNCISVKQDYCITPEELQDRIKGWGGKIQPEIRVKEFMNSKKSYEVQKMSRLVASLHDACASTCCIEAGGGRGHLPVALTLGYNVPSLTIDCDQRTLSSATERIRVIQKQWHAIAKKVKDGNEEKLSHVINQNLHRFASAYITKSTDISAIVREKFPEFAREDVRLLLTGLHTCGNLGPDSLRIFTAQPSVTAVFNVPCCYHLLSEEVDSSLFDVFQKDYGCEEQQIQGFPMSEHLRGYNLGRNARMLAAQSIDRVVGLRQLPSKSLLCRALLQVIVKKHLPDIPLCDGKLKRIGNKCADFDQYFKMADETLDLKLYNTLPVNYLTDFCKNIDIQWKQLVLFYLLRLCLAQVIESIILLDRLLYLCENGFQKVFLVKLFDPVLSPRCHSIVAVR